MSLNQTRIWTCDLCDKTETTRDSYPIGWIIGREVTCCRRKVHADFCPECWYRAFPVHESENSSDVATGEFKKPFWKRFFA